MIHQWGCTKKNPNSEIPSAYDFYLKSYMSNVQSVSTNANNSPVVVWKQLNLRSCTTHGCTVHLIRQKDWIASPSFGGEYTVYFFLGAYWVSLKREMINRYTILDSYDLCCFVLKDVVKLTNVPFKFKWYKIVFIGFLVKYKWV